MQDTRGGLEAGKPDLGLPAKKRNGTGRKVEISGFPGFQLPAAELKSSL
jgi:hypothetical protein